jgi:hypothetical protein
VLIGDAGHLADDRFGERGGAAGSKHESELKVQANLFYSPPRRRAAAA